MYYRTKLGDLKKSGDYSTAAGDRRLGARSTEHEAYHRSLFLFEHMRKKGKHKELKRRSSIIATKQQKGERKNFNHQNIKLKNNLAQMPCLNVAFPLCVIVLILVTNCVNADVCLLVYQMAGKQNAMAGFASNSRSKLTRFFTQIIILSLFFAKITLSSFPRKESKIPH